MVYRCEGGFEEAGQGPPRGPRTKKGDSTSYQEERLGTGSIRPRRPLRLIYYEACLSEGTPSGVSDI